MLRFLYKSVIRYASARALLLKLNESELEAERLSSERSAPVVESDTNVNEKTGAHGKLNEHNEN